MNKRFFIASLILFLTVQNAFAKSLRELFSNNEAIIYTLNIRNFNAQDIDNDGIIDFEKGDIKGTFLNAMEKLEELKEQGINTLYLLPITKTGKIKALGTAGSLYAMNSFDELNLQLDDLQNELSIDEEAKLFINKAHSLGLKVIVDLPSCAAYDLVLSKPKWLLLDKNQEPIVPADWTDVRLFKIYNEHHLNPEMIENFKKFVDKMQALGFDGIRADVAAIKPYGFWKNIIDYSRKNNPDFFFLAEASPDWSNPAPTGVNKYASVDELLLAGFDCYYGSWSDYKNIKSKQEFEKKFNRNLKILKRHKNKSQMIALATHDQQAPILRGKNYWKQALWLSVTLPLNTYFLDGFSYGDNFTYIYENQKAKTTDTDDEFYFVHSGMFDIFNFSIPAKKTYPELKKEYLKAIKFKKENIEMFKNANYVPLKTQNDKIIAYSILTKTKELVVIASLDENFFQEATIKTKYLKNENMLSLISSNYYPKTNKNEIKTILEPLDIQVFMINRANSPKS